MVKYTPQAEWIERRGILLWLAFFFIELGAGIFFVSAFFGILSIMLTGWLVCAVIGGGLHLIFLGKPLRFWRILLSSGWKTSWISRGLIFVFLFLVLGLIHMSLSLWSNPLSALLVTTNLFSFLTVIYGGFAMNYINGIPLWNSALLPIMYLISGIWGGAEVTLGLTLAGAGASAGLAAEEWIRLLLIGFLILIPVYLLSVRHTSLTGQASVRLMVLGKWSPLFWIGVVIVGMVIPLITVICSFFLGLEVIPAALFYAAILCGLLGDLITRYLILRCGMYNPLFNSNPQTMPIRG
jgi:formate-dependent nitrite reductase membrane component NrfD